jgi:hypothetical protein
VVVLTKQCDRRLGHKVFSKDLGKGFRLQKYTAQQPVSIMEYLFAYDLEGFIQYEDS